MNRVNLLHTCGVNLQFQIRTIIAKPEDPTWPKDYELVLPYCPNCKHVVGMREIVAEVNV